MSSSFSGDKINFPHPNIGTDNDESKETKNFVPSPELSEDSSHASDMHDSYPVSIWPQRIFRLFQKGNKKSRIKFVRFVSEPPKVSDLSENNPSNFVPSTNPLIITQSYQPDIAGVQQKHHSHIGKLPVWPYPYENIDNKYKWKIVSSEHKHKGDGKLLLPTVETTVTGKSTIYSDYPSEIMTSPPSNFYRQPFAYDVPVPQITSFPTPFSYTTIATTEIPTSDIESTPDNRLPPWMEMLHIKNDAFDGVKAPIEYYNTKAIENQPNQPQISQEPPYGLTYIDKKYIFERQNDYVVVSVFLFFEISNILNHVFTVCCGTASSNSWPQLYRSV